MLPSARKNEMIVFDMNEELIVYDKQRHLSHVLNRPSALVWQNCNGTNRIDDLVGILQLELSPQADADAVWQALELLEKKGLLTDPLPQREMPRLVSRRNFTLAAATCFTVLIPLITSTVVPTAAQVSSCINQPCDG